MKRILLILVVLSIVTSLNARVVKKSMIEIAPRLSIYISEDNAFGIGSDIIFNPLKNIGFRIEAGELLFNGGTYFMLNHGALSTFPKIDALIYIPMRQMNPYIHTGLGLTTGEGFTLLAIGGGMGFDFEMRRGTTLFIEPGLYILSASNGASDTDVVFRLTLGAKFGLFR
ncbi:MAG: hypothetical protein JSV97_11025 [candidate division WOR-3 bacterium]|nr:MAG: hypothetical protein JSV97_11025 [candidate division WOR-3 bacterium]